MLFHDLNGDQRRELVNTRQRFDAWRAARDAANGFRGSMVWKREKARDYLVRSDYGPSGLRRQRSLGARSTETERIKDEFDAGRERANSRFTDAEAFLTRQAAINRAVGIGRVPLISARIVRALDRAGLLGEGLRIVGTTAIFAYEAVAGVFVESSITATDDLDLLFDARQRIRLITPDRTQERSLLKLLQRVDHSFERMPRTFSAVNRDGFVVDLIKPMPEPPWKSDREQIAPSGEADLVAVAIEGLRWLENAPLFEAVAIDERGAPLAMAVPDPRAFAVHKLWLSRLANRPPLQRQRDRAQAEAVAGLVTRHLLHLPFNAADLSALPRALVDAARPLFSPPRA